MFVHNSCLRVSSSGETTLKTLLLFLGVNPQTPPPFLTISVKQLAFHYLPQIGPRHIICLKENSLKCSLHKQLPTPETHSCAENAPEEKGKWKYFPINDYQIFRFSYQFQTTEKQRRKCISSLSRTNP